jgi:hypothetical protein
MKSKKKNILNILRLITFIPVIYLGGFLAVVVTAVINTPLTLLERFISLSGDWYLWGLFGKSNTSPFEIIYVLDSGIFMAGIGLFLSLIVFPYKKHREKIIYFLFVLLLIGFSSPAQFYIYEGDIILFLAKLIGITIGFLFVLRLLKNTSLIDFIDRKLEATEMDDIDTEEERERSERDLHDQVDKAREMLRDGETESSVIYELGNTIGVEKATAIVDTEVELMELSEYARLANEILDVDLDDLLLTWKQNICFFEESKYNTSYYMASILILAEIREMLFNEYFTKEAEVLDDYLEEEIQDARKEIYNKLFEKYGSDESIYEMIMSILPDAGNIPSISDKTLMVFSYISNGLTHV